MNQNQKEWEKTFDSIDDWICIIDLESRIQRSNLTGEKLFGLRIQEIIGQKCCHLSHGTDKPVEKCPLPRMIETGKRASSELQIQDGRWMFITVDPLFDDKGIMTGAVHIARDISQRIQNQNEREKLLQDLTRALAQVKKLSGLLPICSYCKRIRDDKGYWNQLESYIRDHSDAEFSHGICQECAKKHYPDYYIHHDEP
ncbi:MAG: PAS domain-containing protein [Pseudomonadota bacterium]